MRGHQNEVDAVLHHVPRALVLLKYFRTFDVVNRGINASRLDILLLM